MGEKQTGPDTSTEFARERTSEAADRTLMAWIRTALSLISFGFGVGKIFDLLDQAYPEKHLDPLHTGLVVAISLVVLGMLSLLGAIIQYWQRLKHLEQGVFTYKASRALTGGVAILLLVIGLFSLVGIIAR